MIPIHQSAELDERNFFTFFLWNTKKVFIKVIVLTLKSQMHSQSPDPPNRFVQVELWLLFIPISKKILHSYSLTKYFEK